MLAEGAGTIRSRSGDATGVVLHDGWLRVELGDGYADFHLRWLRHNCDQDRHALTNERTVDSSDDVVLYDNHRMLHARTAFQGSRWLRGIYFNPR